MAFAELAGVRLQYECVGRADGPAVVLAHSLGADMQMWAGQVRALKERYRLVVYDARGHGRSTTPDGPYTIEDLGGDLAGLMDWLELEKAYVGGVSLGGQTALWMGIYRPERVLGVIAANTAAKIGTAEVWDERIAQVTRDGVGSVVDGALTKWFTPGFLAENEGLEELVRHNLERMPAAGYAACCASLRDADLRRTVRMIAAPTLVIAGTHDVTTPVSEAEFLRREIVGAKMIELDAAHLSNVERAAEFSAAMVKFLDATSGPGRSLLRG